MSTTIEFEKVFDVPTLIVTLDNNYNAPWSLTRTLTYRKRAVKLVDWKIEPNSAG